MSDSSLPLPQEIQDYYARGDEVDRLSQGTGQLEKARTQELVRRFLPKPPAVIVDVGGGSGVYACWLARLGYEVHLVDASPLLVEQARHAAAQQPDSPLASAVVGDARSLQWPDHNVDAVLLLGPLYHLTHRADRLAALREARRILRDGGLVLAAGISRFASTLDGLRNDLLADPAFVRIVERDLAKGQHRNPEGHAGYFTTAYLHHPRELREELEQAGLRHLSTLAIEGPGWLLGDLDARWQDPGRRARLLTALRWIESEPSILGASAHMLAVGRNVAAGTDL
jgi:ubiquinone/menaquinone biosynthesis C-methylase UbiE